MALIVALVALYIGELSASHFVPFTWTPCLRFKCKTLYLRVIISEVMYLNIS